MDCLHSSGANFDENVTGSLGSLGYVKILHLVAKFGHQGDKHGQNGFKTFLAPGGQIWQLDVRSLHILKNQVSPSRFCQN